MALNVTEPPVPSDSLYINWGNGDVYGGLYGGPRVSSSNKIKASDINQMRTVLEAMARHTHAFEDDIGGC